MQFCIDTALRLCYNAAMVNYKVTHKYRDCTISATPIDEFISVIIYDNLSCEKIMEEGISKYSPLKTAQVISECELFIDKYIEDIESLGNVK